MQVRGQMRDGSKKENDSPAPGDLVDAAPPTPPTSAAASAATATSTATRDKVQISTTSSDTIFVRRLGNPLDHGENPSNLEVINPGFRIDWSLQETSMDLKKKIQV